MWCRVWASHRQHWVLSSGRCQIWTIPEAIGNLQALTTLLLLPDALTGAIPETIGDLQALTHVYLHPNALTGTVPEAIVNPQALTALCQIRTRLTGTIPDAIGNLLKQKVMRPCVPLGRCSVRSAKLSLTRTASLKITGACNYLAPRADSGKSFFCRCLSLWTTHIGDVDPNDVPNAVAFARALVAVLNYGFGTPPRLIGAHYRPTAAQHTCLCTLGLRILEFVERLRSDIPSDCSPDTAWETYEARGTVPRLDLVADQVDYPEVAGTCDPMSIIPADIAGLLSDVHFMFPAPPPGLEHFSGFYAGDRESY